LCGIITLKIITKVPCRYDDWIEPAQESQAELIVKRLQIFGFHIKQGIYCRVHNLSKALYHAVSLLSYKHKDLTPRIRVLLEKQIFPHQSINFTYVTESQ
jgi:hypothetical protein